MENTVVRIQDERSRVVLLTNKDYKNKVAQQTQKFERKVKLWIDKWQSNKTSSNDWIKFITSEHSKPGKMYDNIKTHK